MTVSRPEAVEKINNWVTGVQEYSSKKYSEIVSGKNVNVISTTTDTNNNKNGVVV
jgi:hypothetical protein